MGDARELYRTDFHAWALGQAEALRALALERPNVPIDLEHLSEEVEALSGSERDAVFSFAELIVRHLLLLEHSPAVENRDGWEEEVAVHRVHLRRKLRSGSLRRYLREALDEVYADARDIAALKMRRFGEDAGGLPAERPYGYEQVVGDWLPPDGGRG